MPDDPAPPECEPVSVVAALRSRFPKWFPPRGSLRARMARGVFWSVGTGIVTRGLFLALSVLMARLLGESEYGKWGTVYATVGVFSMMAGLGIGNTLTKHVAELRQSEPVRAGRVFVLAAQVALISNTVLSVAVFLLAGVIAGDILGSPELVVPLAVSSLLVFSQSLSMILQSALSGFEAFRDIARIRLAEMVVTFAFMLGLTWAFGLTGAIVGFAVGQFVSVGLFSWRVREEFRERGIPLRWSGAWREAHILWRFSLPALLTGLINAPARWFGVAMVVRQPGGYGGMAGYAAGERWQGAIVFIPRQLMMVSLPILSQLRGAGQWRRYRRAVAANLALSVGIAIVPTIPIVFLSPWIMQLYGEGFRDKWDILAAMVAISVLQAAIWVLGRVFLSLDKVWHLFAINVFWGAAVAVGVVVLVPAHGARGFVWSLVAAYVLTVVLQCIASWRMLRREERSGPPGGAPEPIPQGPVDGDAEIV